MLPQEYFPNIFKTDVERFGDGVLCGHTLSKLALQIDNWPHLEHFLLCEYELNLLSQAIYSHFRSDHALWIKATEPHIDCRCHHAGSGHPLSALIHVERTMPEFHLDQEVTKELMLSYDIFFMHYLKETCSRENFTELTPKKLLVALQSDKDNHQPDVTTYLQNRK